VKTQHDPRQLDLVDYIDGLDHRSCSGPCAMVHPLEQCIVDAHDLALVLDGLEIVALAVRRIMPAKGILLMDIGQVDGLVEQLRCKYNIPPSPDDWK
jgi:hypothetical protein